jgi:Mg-chelatase subunit ChlD
MTLQASEEGVALAIVYDTSGSMKEPVPDASGGTTPKYVIANRALLAVVRQLQAFATNAATGSSRKIQAGLFTFEGDHAHEVVKFGPFNAKAFENWAGTFSSPHGNTPLGNALSTATHAVMDSPLSRKHVLILTDGLNTAGPAPNVVLPKLKKQASEQHSSFSVHFVAFDVDARQFAALKRQGATVVGAADEKQLNSQLQFILQQKILLEDEEPAKTQ